MGFALEGPFSCEHWAAFTGSRAMKCEHLSCQFGFLDGNPLDAEKKGLIEKVREHHSPEVHMLKLKVKGDHLYRAIFTCWRFFHKIATNGQINWIQVSYIDAHVFLKLLE